MVYLVGSPQFSEIPITLVAKSRFSRFSHLQVACNSALLATDEDPPSTHLFRNPKIGVQKVGHLEM